MNKQYKILLFLLVLIFIQSCGTGDNSWSPQSNELLFMSNKDINSEIYLLKGQDSAWVNLTNNEAGDNWPVWSPDGNRIVFQSTRSGNLDIWLMDYDGSNSIQLTTNDDYDYLPAFTPDGQKITFTSWRKENDEEKRAPHIYIMDTDGSNQKRLLAESMKTSTGVCWHPDGLSFLFSKRGTKGADIYKADLNGKVIRQLTNDTLYTSGARYSPDGSKILFTQDYGEISQILVMNSNGKDVRVLLKDGKNYYPNWSPNGKWIVYSKILPNTLDEDIDVYAFPIDDPTKSIRLAGGANRQVEASWRPM